MPPNWPTEFGTCTPWPTTMVWSSSASCGGHRKPHGDAAPHGPGAGGVRHERAEQIEERPRGLVAFDIADARARDRMIAGAVEPVVIDIGAAAAGHGVHQEHAEGPAVAVGARHGQHRKLSLGDGLALAHQVGHRRYHARDCGDRDILRDPGGRDRGAGHRRRPARVADIGLRHLDGHGLEHAFVPADVAAPESAGAR